MISKEDIISAAEKAGDKYRKNLGVISRVLSGQNQIDKMGEYDKAKILLFLRKKR